MSTERRAQGPGMQQRPGGGMGPWGRGGMGMPVEKAKNFRATLTRLLGYFKPEKYRLLAVLIAAVISTIFTIVGPKILGHPKKLAGRANSRSLSPRYAKPITSRSCWNAFRKVLSR